MRAVVRHLRQVALHQAANRLADGELLEAFLTRGEEAAFETLLRRHGPMVLAVCRRVLRHEHDAEDAFQATFLVLARKANTVRPREMVGPWLYGVAYRTALSARAMNAKRQEKERRAAGQPLTHEPTEEAPEELLRRLDAALARLPDRYRVPIVLCELNGRSRKEVAGMLGVPEGTLSWRLAQAKKLLARRLAPYGAGALALALSQASASACVSPRLLHETAQAALQVVAGESLKAGVASAPVVALCEGVIKAMLLTKIKSFGVVSLTILLVAGAVGLTYRPVAAQAPRPADGSRMPRAVADELDELRLEVAALRKGLEATRERVRALEDEVETLKVRSRGLPPVRARRPANIPETEWAPGMPGGVPPGGRRGRGQPPLPSRPGDAAGAPAAGAAVPGTAMGPGGNTPAPGGAAPRDRRDPRDTRNPAQAPGGAPPAPGKLGPQDPYRVRQADDPLADAEDALKNLRQHPDDRQTADALERALKRLRARQGTDVREEAIRSLLDLQRQSEEGERALKRLIDLKREDDMWKPEADPRKKE